MSETPTSTAIIPNVFREKLLRNEVAYTLSIKLLTTVEIPVIAAGAGYTGIFIDMEHSPFSLETVSQLCITALQSGITPLVRSPSKNPWDISRILDGGAYGVIVPHIHSAQDARDVVDSAKFPPVGSRSSKNCLPHFQFRNLPSKVRTPIVNANTLVIPMIETLDALEVVEEIAAVEGVDSLLVGSADLTAEMGIPGEYDSPRLEEAYRRVIAACAKHGKWVGIGALQARLDLVEKVCGMGANWVMAGADSQILIKGVTGMAASMGAIAEKVNEKRKAA